MSDNIQDRSMLRIGTILHDTYRIDRYLSSGGFGNTYVATNIAFDERVAIKEFFIKGVNQRDENQTTVSVSNRENVNQFEEQREIFKKEARRLRRLHNDHLVRVHDLFDENGTSYYVMDYVDGESLSERLKRTGEPMSEAEAWKILPQVLDALKTVHGQGIWHLDLKPGNIMIDRQGTAKVIDFGASKQLNAQNGGATTSTAVNYTRGYAPREQEAQHYDKFGPWTDLYALGATVYNLVTGNKPPTSMDVEDDGAAAFSFPSAVSARMRDLIEWLMQPNRTRRPQSVDEVIRSMEQSGHKPAEFVGLTSDDETVYKPKAEKKNETESDDETQYAVTGLSNRNAAQTRNFATEGYPSDSKKAGKKWWFIGIGAAVLCALIIVVVLSLGKSGQSQDSVTEMASSIQFTVPEITDNVAEDKELIAQQKAQEARAKMGEFNFQGNDETSTNIKSDKKQLGEVASVGSKGEAQVFTYVEQMPVFPGGEAALQRFIYDHLKYPQASLEKGVQGTVMLRFAVNENGSVGDVQILKSLDTYCDREAKRVVQSLPRFTPGRQHGKPVKVWFQFPIRFELE